MRDRSIIKSHQAKKTVLIVDPEKEIRDFLSEELRAQQYRPILAQDGLEATYKMNNESFDIVITDLNMPKKDGLKLIEDIRRVHENMPVIIITGHLPDYKASVTLLNNVSIVQKPFKIERIFELLETELFPAKQLDKDKQAQKITLSKGEVLLNEGEEGEAMYWLAQGSLEVYKIADEKEVIVGKIDQGELVGEMSFLDDKKRSASVRALEECQLMRIPSTKFAKVLEDQPPWFKTLVKTLSSRLRKTTKKIAL